MRPRARWTAAALASSMAVFVTGAAGCNWLVGVGDYSVGKGNTDGAVPPVLDGGAADATTSPVDAGPVADASANEAARAEAAAAEHDAMVDARGPDADAADGARPGDGGSATDADATDDASPSSEGGAVDAAGLDAGVDSGVACGAGLPVNSADFQKLVSSCLLSVSCDPFLFPVTLSDCITENALASSPSFACLSTITSCVGATNSWYSCEGTRYATTSECPDFTSTCDSVNNVAIDCSYSITGVVTDCTRTDNPSVCEVYDGGSNAGCVVVDPCTLGDGTAQCAGNDRYTCLQADDGSDIGVGRSCGDATCTDASGGADCQFGGTGACASPGTATCNGGTLQSCDANGQAFGFDCTRAGGTCVTPPGGTAQCVSPGCTQASTCVESCDPSTNEITVCVGGAPLTLSCPQYGFSSCGPATGGPVYCVP